SDRTTNGKLVRTLDLESDPTETSVVEVSKPCRSIQVGDLVLVSNREAVPADLVLLASSNEAGSAFVETSSIDGETNLKLRLSPKPPGERALCDSESLLATKLSLLSLCAEASPLLSAEHPNASVNTFSGSLSLSRPAAQPATVSLAAENLLVRGSVLRNTQYAVGVAVYTGADTKLVMNSRKAPSKLSNLDRLVNRAIKFIIVGLCVICTIGASVSTAFNTLAWIKSVGYIYPLQQPGAAFNLARPFSGCRNCFIPNANNASDPFPGEVNWFQAWFTYLTLFSNFVPLSLYVTLEVIIFTLMSFIAKDVNLYHAKNDTWATARSTAVSDLGQVKYVFSDKTGTLTENVMKLKRVGVAGLVFGKRVLQSRASRKNEPPSPLSTPLPPSPSSPSAFDPKFEAENSPSPTFTPASGASSKRNPPPPPYYPPLDNLLHSPSFDVEMFLRTLALCHTVVVEDTEGDASAETGDSFDAAPEGHSYQAESPDESALVNESSLQWDVQLIGSKSGCTVIEASFPTGLGALPGNSAGDPTEALKALVASSHASPPASPSVAGSRRTESWSLLATNKFDSTRKRMSVLMRSPPELGGLPVLFVKGADSAMLSPEVAVGGSWLLHEMGVEPDTDQEYDASGEGLDLEYLKHLLELQETLSEFATDGLRTLVLGARVLTEDEVRLWMVSYTDAVNTVGPSRDDRLMDVANDAERGLHIVGATGIEDKLQEGVPECIEDLHTAGVKVLVLTGDKKETAIEIGYATKLLVPTMDLVEYDDKMDKKKVHDEIIKEFLRLVKKGELPQFSRARLAKDTWEPGLAVKNFMRTTVLRKDRVMSKDEEKRATRAYADEHMREAARAEGSSRSLADLDGAPIESASSVDADEIEDLGPQPKSRIRNVFRRASTAKKLQSVIRETESGIGDDVSIADNVAASTARSTRLERLFSVDKAVRHGGLAKHSVYVGSPEKPKKIRLNKNLKKLRQRLSGNKAAGDQPDDGKISLSSRDLAHLNRSMDSENFLSQPDEKPESAVVITGKALGYIFGNVHLERMLFNIFSCQTSVIACRVSPKQKSLIVRLAKTNVYPRPVTLAIGDGANDVGMIQEAQIGIGISGLEGQQAVNAADFAIAQFRFLKELMLVHGRWNYIRMSKVCMYSFYKNAVLVLTMFFFQIYNHWCGRSQYEDYVVAMFNFFLGVPILAAGIFDRDITKMYARKHPETYVVGRENQDLSRRIIFRWTALAIVHGCVLYFFAAKIYSNGMSGYAVSYFANGSGGGLATFGTSLYTIMIISLTITALLNTKTWVVGVYSFKTGVGRLWDRIPYTLIGVFVTTIGLIAVAFGVYQQAFFANWSQVQGFFFLVPPHVFVYRPVWYLQLVVVCAVANLADVMFKCFGFFYYPSQTLVHQEISELERRALVKS
ncbi:hypothetical protein TeGR_g11442, partial [Tetraparma gracilis]